MELRLLRDEAEVGSEGDDRPRARCGPVDGGDDRQRALSHRLDDRTGHAGELEEAARIRTDQVANDVVDIAARAEAAALPGHDEHRDVATVRHLAQQIA